MSLSHVFLACGRSIELTELRMSSTYAGLLEGYPFKRINDMKIERLRRAAERGFPVLPVHVVPPVREHPEGVGTSFGPGELLPPVECIGVFRSSVIDTELDSVLHYSALTVVWFQTAVSVPSGDDADPALRGIDWDALARDLEV